MKTIHRATCVALALLALGTGSGTAYAQSNVRMYGVVDLGLLYANGLPGTGGAPAGHTVHVDSGQILPSRLGFAGREDLGGGMAALFVLEMGISMDTGTFGQGGRGFGRASYVGLSGAPGEIQLGRQTTAVYDFGATFDPINPSRFSSPTFDTQFAGRADNAVKYIGRFNNFNIRSQYSFGYDSLIANGGEQAAYKVGKQAGVAADYSFGAFTVGGAVDRQNGTSVATSQDNTRRSMVGASWNVQPVKLFVAYERQRVEVSGRATENNFYWLAAQFSPMPQLTLTPGFYVYDPAGSSNRAKMPTLLATYALSKRTDLYAQAAHISNQSAATSGLVLAAARGTSQSAYTVGIRHRF